jgi:hypothetical protein
MSRDIHVPCIRIAALAAAFAVLVAAPPRGRAEQERRVVVADFVGPAPTSKAMHDVILEIVSDLYQVLPYSRYRIARRRLNITKESMKTVAAVAKKIGADAIIEGEVTGRRLTIAVREGRSGRVLDRFSVNARGKGVSEATREAIIDEIVDLIDWTEPVSGAADGTVLAGVDQPATAAMVQTPGEVGSDAPGSPRASLTAAQPKPQASVEKWSVTEQRDRARARAAKRRPPAIQVRAAVGVAAIARQLQFAHQIDLAEDERPLSMSGSPSGGVAVSGTFDVNPLGLSAELVYQRSIGASVSFPAGGQTKQLGISLQHIGARLMIRRAVHKRVNLRGGAGYHQLGFAISNRPNGLLIPDSRYSYADVGGGARLSLRDDRLSISADLWYLHVLSAGGITAATAFGSSRFHGFGGEVGLEIDAGDTTFVRVAGTYQRIILAFNGDGAWATGLDESSDVDVSGATDSYVGGVAMLGFRL